MGTGNRGRRLAAVCITGVCSLLFAAPALAADGDLDPTFAGDGTAAIDFAPANPNAFADVANDLVAQSDGKIVSAGGALKIVFSPGIPPLAENDIALARQNANGSLDSSFSGDGRVILDTGASETAAAVTEGPGGTYLVAGSSTALDTGADSVLLARFEADGDPDPTFSGDGVVTQAFGSGSSAANDVVVQDDGKIVVVGDASGGQMLIARFNADGTLDSGFAGGGSRLVAIRDSSFAEGVALQDDGEIVVAGRTIPGAGTSSDMALVRLEADGDLDPTFSDDGVATPGFGANALARAVQVQPNGRIVAAGSILLGSDDFAVVRFLEDGSLDTSFGGDGLTTIGTAVTDVGRDLALQENGRPIISGSSNGDFTVARFRANGDPDLTFSGDGLTSFENGFESEPSGAGVSIQPDGNIVSTGGNNSDMIVARFLADADVPDTTIGDGPTEGSTISDRTPEFGFTSDEGGGNFVCAVDGGAFADCEDPHTVDPLPNGTHTFRVAAVDAAENTDPVPAERTFNVNNLPSAVGDDTVTATEDSGANPIAVLVNDSDPDDPIAVTASISRTTAPSR